MKGGTNIDYYILRGFAYSQLGDVILDLFLTTRWLKPKWIFQMSWNEIVTT